MTTVAIICEYNPFHNGHKHHIDAIRREFGEDTAVIAIMSGSFTQRGESAIMDKTDRAKCAVLSGADLVLELPFPFSMSSAELFALASVSIANDLGIVDYLSFGSECGDIETLISYARATTSDEYRALFEQKLACDELASLGYPRVAELVFKELYGDSGITLTPNNILAVEYIKALLSLECGIKPHTVKRTGAEYSENDIVDGVLQSASAIRSAVVGGNLSALDFVPEPAKEVMLDAYARGAFPCEMDRLSPAVISFFRLSPISPSVEIHDAAGGLYNRLRNASFEAENIKTLVTLSETKKYTNARILRATWYSFFGVTSSDVKAKPLYTQLLAMNGTGRSCLKEIGRRGSIPVITKPSATDTLDDGGRKQKALSDRADSIFHLTRRAPVSGSFSLTFTPYVKI